MADAKKKSEPKEVVYESRNPEPAMFDCADIASVRVFSDNRLQWTIDSADEARFRQHHFVSTGRIVKKS
jgi:hypothetical protein